MTSNPAGVTKRTWSLRGGVLQWLQVGVLGAVWVLLWGRYDLPTLLMGLVLGLIVVVVFPLPPVKFAGTVRPHWWVLLVLWLVWELVRASAAVAWAAITKGGAMTNAIIGVPLRTKSDFVLAQTVELTSLVPGSVVLETRRHEGSGEPPTIYLHVMDVTSPESIERARREVRRTEAWVIRAFGTKADYAILRSEQGKNSARTEGEA